MLLEAGYECNNNILPPYFLESTVVFITSQAGLHQASEGTLDARLKAHRTVTAILIRDSASSASYCKYRPPYQHDWV